MNDKFKEAFPREYAHLGELVKNSRIRLHEIERELKGIQNTSPKPQAPTPSWDKANDGHWRERDIRVMNLNTEKSAILKNTPEQVEKEMKGVDPKVLAKTKEKTVYLLDLENKLVDKSTKDLDKSSHDLKRDNVSFEYMAAIHYEQKSFSKYREQEKVNTKAEMKDFDTASERFNNKLNFARELKAAKEPEKEIQPDKGIQEPSIDDFNKE